jgi:hypothetical protein
MARAQDYRRLATECLRLAQQISNPTDRAMLLHMAERWRELSETGRRDDRPDDGQAG